MKAYFTHSITRSFALYLLTACWVLTAFPAQAQEVTITGTVKELSTGQTMPGVNVTVKGTQTGTITDIDGKYSVSAPVGGTLVFSFIGYENVEKVVTSATTIDADLKEFIESLDEVVVIGYGTSTKKEVTGSVASLKAKDFNQGNFNDPMGLIQGKVAGLSISKPDGADPMAGYQILLRGTNTLIAGQGPLIIIDGVIGADLKNINFQDVETFDVLKDGSAAAIYGTRGTNGVIIITTKHARSGQTRIEYSAQVSAQVASRRVENLSADEFKSAIETYQPSKASNLYGASTDWFKEITRDIPISFQHNIALSGGTDKFSHRTSFVISDDKGLLKDNESRRMLLRSNIKQKAFDDRLELDLNFTNNIRTYKPANYDLFYQAFIQNPTQPIYDPGNTETGGYSMVSALEYYNPVAMLNERKRDGKTTDVVINLRATVKITDKLNWVNFFSTQKSAWEDNSYKTQFYPGSLGKGGEAEINNGRSDQHQYESTVNYGTSFGDHSVEAVGGYSYQEFQANSSYMGNFGFDTDIYSYNNIGAGSARTLGTADMGSNREVSKLISMFGRLKYNYREKYLVSASMRREGSSRFGANRKWGWFPAVSVGWRLNQEDFMSNVSWINEMKLRVGYGVTGNQDFSNYQSLVLLAMAGRFFYNGEWINSYEPASNPNPDLRWEKKQELDIGIDFSIFQNRITGTLDYYSRKISDVLYKYPVPVPPYLYPEIMANVGAISNQGIELTVNTLAMKRNNFQWNTIFTASHNTNMLDKLSNEQFTTKSVEMGFIGGAIGVNSQRMEEGKSLGTFYGPVWLGVDETGNDVFKNANPVGDVNKNDWEKIGTAYPVVSLGWSNSLNYKNWNLSFTFRSSIGGKVLNTYRVYYENWSAIGVRNIVKSQLDNPKFTADATYSSKYLENATFVKLDNVTLGYNFNIDFKYISKLSVYGSAQNVLMITGYKGLDPEVNLGGLTPGIEYRSYYPRTTSVTLGLNATF